MNARPPRGGVRGSLHRGRGTGSAHEPPHIAQVDPAVAVQVGDGEFAETAPAEFLDAHTLH
ncbi:MAG: hypothetical protein ACK559_20550, partial [bacterium]